jgi:hypothetical protein
MKYFICFICTFCTIQLAISQTNITTNKVRNCHIDSDDDGINDCMDQCDDTPKNARVDSKGCPRDTDGDGIPDYKDKQLITPTECQPTDTNGIGNCNRVY